MTRRTPPDDEVDRLLRDALGEDTPAGAEDDLRVFLRQSWQRLGAEAGGAAPGRPWWLVAVPQPLVTAAALLLLVAGGALHAAGAPRAVAESLSLRQISVLAGRAVAGATAMDGTVETRGPRGGWVRYRVRWRAREATTLRIESDAGVTETRLPPREPGASVLDPRAAGTGSGAAPWDPGLRTVEGYLSPRGLAALLTGSWRVAASASAGTQAYVVESVSRGARLRVVLDERTHLPVRIEAGPPATRATAGTTAVFRWGDS